MNRPRSRNGERGFTRAFKSRIFLLLFLFFSILASLFIGSNAHAAQVTLAWTASTSSNVAGYKLYYGTVSGSYAYFVDVGNTTSYTLTGLSAGATYYFVTTAYDSSGDQSASSNQVSYTVPSACTYSISAPSVSVSASGATGTVSVTTQNGCAWTATSAASWMSITAGSSGTGNGTVSYSVAANTATSSRTAVSTFAGLSFTVTQAAAAVAKMQIYTITASAGTGGSISPAGSVPVSSGTTQSFSITPKSGYAISSVTIDGKSKGKLTSYTFSNVTANHTIRATFASRRR